MRGGSSSQHKREDKGFPDSALLVASLRSNQSKGSIAASTRQEEPTATVPRKPTKPSTGYPAPQHEQAENASCGVSARLLVYHGGCPSRQSKPPLSHAPPRT